MTQNAEAERVAVVTDSTAFLPAGLAESLNVRVVPLRVSIGTRSGTDGVDVTAREVAQALHYKITVTTSRPSPAEFAAVFQSCLDAGATRVVAVLLASALSGTWESAALAAQDFGHGVIRVVDSRSTAMALGFAVMSAANRAAEGASAAEVQSAATETVDRTRTLFYVDTVEYLRRGGRIGNAAAFVATSLAVKPLLQMVEGRIVPLEKVRTSTKAIARLVQLTADAAGSGPVDVAVHHLAAGARAEQVANALRSAIDNVGELHIAEIGPVVGAHLGPGAIGTVVVRR
jgi:DegV family protein with EDD domain